MNDKFSYLSSKIEKKECPNFCKEYSTILKKNIQCGICFWNDVTLPLENIPECSRCKNDNIKIKEMMKDNNENTIKCEISCTPLCLWYDWFDNKRKHIIKDKVLIIIKKDDKTKKNKENK